MKINPGDSNFYSYIFFCMKPLCHGILFTLTFVMTNGVLTGIIFFGIDAMKQSQIAKLMQFQKMSAIFCSKVSYHKKNTPHYSKQQQGITLTSSWWAHGESYCQSNHFQHYVDDQLMLNGHTPLPLLQNHCYSNKGFSLNQKCTSFYRSCSHEEGTKNQQ